MSLRDRLRQSLQPVELRVACARRCNTQLSGVVAQLTTQPARNDADALIGTDALQPATSDATAAQLASCTAPATAHLDATAVARVARPFDRRFRLSAADAGRCHAGGWTDVEIAAFTTRHVRLLALGFTGGDADDLAERLTLRDRDGDERRLCVECAHYRGGRCRQAAQSGVGPEVGALALVLQNCPAFTVTGPNS